MSGTQQRNIAYGSIALLAVAFVGIIMASNSLLRGWRIDLTDNDLYTLSPGTRALLENIEEPVNLYYFFSDRETADVQFLRSYATRVSEMLEELAVESDGALSLQIIDPVPFSEDEDRAAQYGLRNLGVGSLGDSIYFGLAATNSVGDEAIIDFFDPSKEASLEYDLARLIYSLATPQKSVVGLISGVPMTGGFNPQTQQPTSPWIIHQQIMQLFEVRNLSASIDRIDDDINLLWIVHPNGLDDAAVYAIDQFLLGGGRAVIFVDPMAEIATVMPDPSGAGGATSSDLPALFDAWGLDFDPASVVADNRYALSVNTGASNRPVRHIGLIGLEPGAINEEDLVTAGLESINVGTVGYLATTDAANIELEPLLVSSTDSALLPAARFQFLNNPDELLDDFSPDGEQRIIAARITGSINTAFPDGPPASSQEDADTFPPQLMETESANIIVVADVDILSDRLWVQLQRSLFGQQLATAFANNGDFVSNVIANLAGSEDLIGLKSRASFARPFERVEALRREADAQFRATEQRLQSQLADTERRLGELQSAREDSGSLLMSPEQQAEIDRFRDEQLRIRQELRSVQRELDSSIEQLGSTLKVLNIVVVPIGLALLALLAHLINRRRRTRSR